MMERLQLIFAVSAPFVFTQFTQISQAWIIRAAILPMVLAGRL
jgi:hypothetical protein